MNKLCGGLDHPANSARSTSSPKPGRKCTVLAYKNILKLPLWLSICKAVSAGSVLKYLQEMSYRKLRIGKYRSS